MMSNHESFDVSEIQTAGFITFTLYLAWSDDLQATILSNEAFDPFVTKSITQLFVIIMIFTRHGSSVYHSFLKSTGIFLMSVLRLLLRTCCLRNSMSSSSMHLI